jgi:hypothetical protein
VAGPDKADKQSEAHFAAQLQRFLASELSKDYVVHRGKNLRYKLHYDGIGQIVPGSDKAAMRGDYAFQTDLLVEKKKPSIPLVVIELKYGNFSSHDIITYSAKASCHKDVYPYLMYGFVVGGRATLSRKFFTHNEGVDFAMALPNLKSGGRGMVMAVKRQIRNAETLLNMLHSRRSDFLLFEKTLKISS